jgi:hypothetical protein
MAYHDIRFTLMYFRASLLDVFARRLNHWLFLNLHWRPKLELDLHVD